MVSEALSHEAHIQSAKMWRIFSGLVDISGISKSEKNKGEIKEKHKVNDATYGCNLHGLPRVKFGIRRLLFM